MSNAPLHKLIAQHAQTANLLGVDFVPCYRTLQAAPQPAPRAPTPIKPAVGRDRQAHQQALDAIHARYLADKPHQAFGYSFTNIVFGEGDPAARLMFVGEAPGAEEDRTGRPFVGRAGKLLDGMLSAMGLSREHVYIANVLKIRPPNNATPTPEERNASAPYLCDQIAAVMPEVIVTLGLPATQTILRTDLPMSKLRGQWATFTHPDASKACTVPVMPTYHPAYLLRSYTPENRKLVWSDLKKVIEKLTA